MSTELQQGPKHLTWTGWRQVTRGLGKGLGGEKELEMGLRFREGFKNLRNSLRDGSEGKRC